MSSSSADATLGARPRLSLCLIVKNEAHQIDRCLGSVAGWADELLVLDTGSTDDTVARAQALGAKVAHFEWCDDFAAARNVALEQVTGDWVLVLDADEWLLPIVREPILQAIAQPKALVVNLIRCELGATQSPYSLVSRLFRRHPEVRFDRPYHAIIDDSVEALLAREPEWQIVSLPLPAIAHEGYKSEAIARGDKARRAQVAMEKYYADHPNDPYVCSKLGALLLDLGEAERGFELLRRAVPIAEEQQATEVLYELHYHLAIAYTARGNRDLAKANYRAALKQPVLAPLKLGALVNLGNLHLEDGETTPALQHYEAAIAIDPNFAKARHNLGLAYKAAGKLTQAIEQYRRAIAIDAEPAEFHQSLGVALLSGGNPRAAVVAFKEAIGRYETSNPPEASRIRQTLAEIGFQV